MRNYSFHILILLIALSFTSFSQKQKYYFGIQYKPILAIEALGVKDIESTNGDLSATYSGKYGSSFGMFFRRNYTRALAIETGINFVKRNYSIETDVISDNMATGIDFGVVSYEIPIQGLVYVRLGKRLYANVATGFSFNWVASDLFTLGENRRFNQFSAKTRTMNFAYLANVGMEYRTKKKGFFYLGFSMHRPFHTLLMSYVEYNNLMGPTQKTFADLDGNFITLDLRYIFKDSK